jgi:hypothetical protein
MGLDHSSGDEESQASHIAATSPGATTGERVENGLTLPCRYSRSLIPHGHENQSVHAGYSNIHR